MHLKESNKLDKERDPARSNKPESSDAGSQDSVLHSQRQIDPFEVSHLEREEDPQYLSTARKWVIVVCISSAATCVASASSMVRKTVIYIFV